MNMQEIRTAADAYARVACDIYKGFNVQDEEALALVKPVLEFWEKKDWKSLAEPDRDCELFSKAIYPTVIVYREVNYPNRFAAPRLRTAESKRALSVACDFNFVLHTCADIHAEADEDEGKLRLHSMSTHLLILYQNVYDGSVDVNDPRAREQRSEIRKLAAKYCEPSLLVQ